MKRGYVNLARVRAGWRAAQKAAAAPRMWWDTARDGQYWSFERVRIKGVPRPAHTYRAARRNALRPGARHV